jgi:hypothetical protein
MKCNDSTFTTSTKDSRTFALKLLSRSVASPLAPQLEANRCIEMFIVSCFALNGTMR